MRRLIAFLLIPALLCACGSDSSAASGSGSPSTQGEPTASTSGGGGQGVVLEVHNPSSVPALSRVVSVGVPLPRWPIPLTGSPSGLFVVVDPNGQTVPTQVKSLARWGGLRDDASKPMKWILVTFEASVPANSIRYYELRIGPAPAGELQVIEEATQIRIRPKAGVEMVIDKDGFQLLSSLTTESGLLISGAQAGLRYTDHLGADRQAYVTDTIVEEAGSLRAVICQKGVVGDLAFTCRRIFHSAEVGMTVDFRLENPGAYGQFSGQVSHHQYFDSISLHLPLVQNATEVVSESGAYTLGSAQYELRQGFSMSEPLNLISNFWYSEDLGPQSLSSGERYGGALSLESGMGHALVAVDRFWQSFPKALRADASGMSIDLWPSWGNGPEFSGQYSNPWIGNPIDPLAIDNYRFEGGRWKTHRLRFSFGADSLSPSDVQSFAESCQTPVAARPDPRWTRNSMATGIAWVERRQWNENSLARYERLHDMIADDSAADLIPQMGQLGLPGFRNRGGTPGGRQWYGWENFGDIPWGEGYSSLHYDWVLNTLLDWYRGGSYGFFDQGRDMAWHRRDLDQNHSAWAPDSWSGAQFYEKGWWHGNSNPGAASHTWIHGVLLHYAMTGDEASYEAAQEAKNYFLSVTPANWNGYWGARIPGWTLQNLLDCYNYLGDSECLTQIQGGLANWEALEAQSGSQGYVLNPGFSNQMQIWMHNIFFNGAARYALTTGDTTYNPLLQRMMNFFRNEALIPAGGPANSYSLPGTWSTWSPAAGGAHASFHLLWPMLESFTLSSFLFGNPSDIAKADELFEALTHYHQNPTGWTVDLGDPSGWSTISMRMFQFPNSESKILANLLRWGRGYVALRSLLAGDY